MAEERALWKTVTRSVAPLRGPPAAEPTEDSEAAAAPVAGKPIRRASPAPQPVPGPPPLAPLEKRLRQRIARGSREIDDRLDLHGMTQERAHGALLSFLRNAQASGYSVVLVITGKGIRGGGANADERGVLKRQVPHWLRLPEFRSYVVGFETAHVTHGGEGALYIRIRRARKGRL
jgi:DNA-nicking Smr family endonuclease